MKHHDTANERRERLGIVRGVNRCTKLPKNYYAEFQHNKTKYYKYFGTSIDPDTNRKMANNWVTNKRKEIKQQGKGSTTK